MHQLDPRIEAYAIVETPLGPMAVGAHGHQLRGVILPRLGDGPSAEAEAARIWPGGVMRPGVLPEVVAQVRRYWQGKQTEAFQADLDLEGFSSFQGRVWREVMAIRPGETRTYGEVAWLVDSPRACRAVGQAMARNPFPLIVPCHRVVAEGSGGGFSAPGGVQLKQQLLDLDRRQGRRLDGGRL